MFTSHTVLAYNIFFVFLVHKEMYRLACLLTWLGAKLQFNTGMKTERHDWGWGGGDVVVLQCRFLCECLLCSAFCFIIPVAE